MRQAQIHLKTRGELMRLSRSAAVVREVLIELGPHVRPGARTEDLAGFCRDLVTKRGADFAVPEFPGLVCTSVNEVAAHGVPGPRRLEEGDVVTVDVAIVRDGWHADGAWTYIAGTPTPRSRRLVGGAWRALLAGLGSALPGGTTGALGGAVERAAQAAGLAVIPDFTGHGLGRLLHEAPAVPFVAGPAAGSPIVPGMVLTVEPVVTLGGPEIRSCSDGWSYVTADGAWTAQFEHMVIVTADGIAVPTFPEDLMGRLESFPPF